ncbi:MAG: hypothetical protein WAP52_00345 [Candidatus Sungiibacteriota bacterium]
MPIPALFLEKIFRLAVLASQVAFRGSRLVQKVLIRKIGVYVIEVTHRGYKGADGAISQVVKVFKNGKTEEVWHIVVKAGRIIHRHLLE